jgi:WD40 repeat protein
VIFSPDGKLVATSIPPEPGSTTRPPGFRLSNAADGTFVRDLKYEPGLHSTTESMDRVSAQGASFSPDGQLFAAAAYDPVNFRGVRLWRVSDGAELAGIETMNHPFVAFADNESLITASSRKFDDKIFTWRWQIRDGKLLWSATNEITPSLDYPVGDFSYALGGGKLGFVQYVGPGSSVRIFSGSDGHLLYAFAGSRADSSLAPRPAFAYSRSGKYVATGGQQQSIRIWCVP